MRSRLWSYRIPEELMDMWTTNIYTEYPSRLQINRLGPDDWLMRFNKELSFVIIKSIFQEGTNSLCTISPGPQRFICSAMPETPVPADPQQDATRVSQVPSQDIPYRQFGGFRRQVLLQQKACFPERDTSRARRKRRRLSAACWWRVPAAGAKWFVDWFRTRVTLIHLSLTKPFDSYVFHVYKLVGRGLSQKWQMFDVSNGKHNLFNCTHVILCEAKSYMKSKWLLYSVLFLVPTAQLNCGWCAWLLKPTMWTSRVADPVIQILLSHIIVNGLTVSGHFSTSRSQPHFRLELKWSDWIR